MLDRVLVLLLAAGLSGCAQAFVYGGTGDFRIHYARFGATPPQGNTVTVCHAYTCKMQTPYTFSQKDLAEIRPRPRVPTRHTRSAAPWLTPSPIST